MSASFLSAAQSRAADAAPHDDAAMTVSEDEHPLLCADILGVVAAIMSVDDLPAASLVCSRWHDVFGALRRTQSVALSVRVAGDANHHSLLIPPEVLSKPVIEAKQALERLLIMPARAQKWLLRNVERNKMLEMRDTDVLGTLVSGGESVACATRQLRMTADQFEEKYGVRESRLVAVRAVGFADVPSEDVLHRLWLQSDWQGELEALEQGALHADYRRMLLHLDEDTIGQLKPMLEERLGVRASRQRLVRCCVSTAERGGWAPAPRTEPAPAPGHRLSVKITRRIQRLDNDAQLLRQVMGEASARTVLIGVLPEPRRDEQPAGAHDAVAEVTPALLQQLTAQSGARRTLESSILYEASCLCAPQTPHAALCTHLESLADLCRSPCSDAIRSVVFEAAIDAMQAAPDAFWVQLLGCQLIRRAAFYGGSWRPSKWAMERSSRPGYDAMGLRDERNRRARRTYCIPDFRSQPGSPIFDAVNAVVAAMSRFPAEPVLALRGCMVLSDFGHVAQASGGAARSVCLDIGLPAVLVALERFSDESLKFHCADLLACLHASEPAPTTHPSHAMCEHALELEACRAARGKVEALARYPANPDPDHVPGTPRGQWHSRARMALDRFYEVTGLENPFDDGEESDEEEVESEDGE